MNRRSFFREEWESLPPWTEGWEHLDLWVASLGWTLIGLAAAIHILTT